MKAFDPTRYQRLIRNLVFAIPIALGGGVLLLSLAIELATSDQSLRSVFAGLFNPSYLQSITSISLRAITASTLGVILAAPLCISLIAVKSARTRYSLVALLLVPLLISDTLRAFGWALILSDIDSQLGFNSLYSSWAPILPLTLSSATLCILICFAGVHTAQKRHFRNLLEYTNRRGRLLLVTIPIMARYLIMGWVLSTIYTFGSSAESEYIGGPISISVSALVNSLFEVSYIRAVCGAVALSSVFVLATLLLVELTKQNRLTNLESRLATWLSSFAVQRPGPTSTSNKSWHFLMWGPFLLLIWAPVVFVLSIGLLKDGVPSLAPIQSALSNKAITNSMEYSLIIGVLIGSLSAATSLLATTGAWLRTHSVAVSLLIAFAFVPGEISAIAFMNLDSRLSMNLNDTLLLVLCTYVWIAPFAILLGVFWSLATPPKQFLEIIESTRSYLDSFYLVVVSRSKSLVLSSFILGFVFSLNEAARAKIINAPGNTLNNILTARLNAGSLDGETAAFGLASLVCLISIALMISIVIPALARFEISDSTD